MLSLRHSLASGAIASLATLMPSGLPALGAAPVDQVNVVNPAANPVSTTVVNPQTNPVPATIVNPAASPALKSRVDEPGRTPYAISIVNPSSSQVSCAGQGFCDLFSPPIPAGQRLVIQHISGLVDSVPDPGTPIGVLLQSSTNNAFNAFFISVALRGGGAVYSQFDQPVLVYVDAGGAALVDLRAPNLNTNFIIVNISLTGYLIDCTVISCAAIAP